MFYPTTGTNTMDIENIRLLDGSWKNYLAPVIQKPKTMIDLVFNVDPQANGDDTNRLLQVVSRVQSYLNQVKQRNSLQP
jgi:hypothetical protein